MYIDFHSALVLTVKSGSVRAQALGERDQVPADNVKLLQAEQRGVQGGEEEEGGGQYKKIFLLWK